MYRTNKSFQLNQVLKNYLPGAAHSNFHGKSNDITLCMKHANGSRIWDIDGNEYLDLFGKYGASILGHHYKELDDYICTALNCLTITELDENTYHVCRLLKEWFPHSDMVRFGLSGNEIIQNAFRLARAYTGKQKIIRFKGHFHGTADDVLGTPDCSDKIISNLNIFQSAYSTEGRRENAFESMIVLPWDNLDIFKKTLQRNEKTIAAVIMEPAMCNGGGIFANIQYLNGIRELCTEHNIVLIFDELITGIRNGPGGIQEEIGVIPDLTIAGKAITNGILPLTCLIGKQEIMDLYTEGRAVFAGTYNGYPLSMAAAKATLEALIKYKEKFYNNLYDRSKQICDCFITEAEKQGLPLVIQGHMASPSFHVRSEKLTVYDEFTSELIRQNNILRMCMQANGILAANISRLNMNVILSEDDIDFFACHLQNAISDAKTILQRKKHSK